MPRRPPHLTPTGPPRWWYTVALGLWVGCFGALALGWHTIDQEGLRARELDRAPARDPHTVELALEDPGTRIIYLEFPRTDEDHPWHPVPSGERPVQIWVEPEPDGDAVRFTPGLADYSTQVDGAAVSGFAMAEIDLDAGEHVLYVESTLPLDDARLAVGEPVREVTPGPALTVFALGAASAAVALGTALARRRAARRITTTVQGG